MANDGKIYITISDKRFGKNKAEADEQNNLDKEKEQKNPIGDFVAHQFFNLIKSQATQAITYSINNIGNFTGDYANQTHIQDDLANTKAILGIGLSALAGAKYGGILGAIFATTASIGMTTASYFQEIHAGKVQNRRVNEAINQLRTRAGLNSTNNESRGTDQ